MSTNLTPRNHDEYNKLKQMAIDEHESRQLEQIKERMKSIEESFTNALTMIQYNTLSAPDYPQEFIQTSLQYIRTQWKGPTLKKEQLDDEKKMNVEYFKGNIGNWICRHAKDISYPCILKYIQLLREFLLNVCQNDPKGFRCIWCSFWKQILDANINCNNTKLEVIPGGLLSKYKDIRDELQKHLFQKFSGYVVNLENMNTCKTTKEYKLKIKAKVHQLSTQFTTNHQPPIQQHPTETKVDDNLPQTTTITNQFRSNSTAANEPHITPNTTDVVHTTTHLAPVVLNNHQNSNFTHYRNDGVSHSSNVVNPTQSATYIQHEQKIPIQSQIITQTSETSAMFHRHNNHHDTFNHPMQTPYTYHMNNTQRSQDTAWSNSNNAAHSNFFRTNLDILDEKENVPAYSTNPYSFRSEIAEQQPTEPQYVCNNTHLRPTIRDNHSYNTFMTNPNDNAFYSSNIGVGQPQSRQYIQDITEQKIPAQSEESTQYVQPQPVITTTTCPHNNHHHLMTDTTWSNSSHFNAANDGNFNVCRDVDPSMPETAEQQHTQQPTYGTILDSNISQIQHSYDYMDPSNFASTENTPSQIQHIYQYPPIGYNSSHNGSYATSYNRYNPY